MSSRHDDDGGDIIAAIVIAVIGLIVGIFIADWQKRKNTVRLPSTLELDDIPEPVQPAFSKKTGLYALSFVGVFLTLGLIVNSVSTPANTPLNGGDTTELPILFRLGLFAGGVVAGFATYKLWQAANRAPKSEPPPVPQIAPLDLGRGKVYTIALPKKTDWQPELAHRFIEQILHKLGGRLTFRIIAEPGRISWQILDVRALVEPSVISEAVSAFYPEAEVTEASLAVESCATPYYRYVMRFKHGADFVGPIRYVSDLKAHDPLVTITQEMNGLQAGERVIYTLFVASFAKFAYTEGEKLVTQPTLHPLQFMSIAGMVNATVSQTTGHSKVEKYVPADQRVFREKLNSPLYQSLLVVQVDAPDPERVGHLALFDSHIWQFVNQPYNALAWVPDPWPSAIQYVDSDEAAWATSTLGLFNSWLINANQSWQAHRLIFEPRELASLWHLPHGDFTAPSIVWSRSNQVQMPSVMRNCRDGICLGINRYGGHEELVYLPEINRATHTAIIGMTGTGKSTLLHHLIHQDILANRGVAVIDPHGKLVQDILRSAIPPTRNDDVVVLDFANADNPPPLNLLSVPKGVERGIAAGQLMAVLDKVYGGFRDTPRLADTLWAALVTLWEEETPTVRDVARLFDDVEYRHRLLANLEDVVAQEFWDKFERQSDAQQEQLSYPIIYRMRAFYGNPALYPVTCHPASLDFASLIRANKIILVSLKLDEKRVPPQAQELLGALLVSQLQMAAMESGDRPHAFYLYIDEAQHFVTTALDQMFSEARKQGLSLTIANQYLQQLAGDTLAAVMGNVGAMIAFQCGHEDAQLLAPYMKPGFDAQDLINLDLYHAAVKMRFGKETQPAFSLVTREPLTKAWPSPEALAREAQLRERSIANYMPKTRQAILDWLARRYPRPGSVSRRDAGPSPYDTNPPALQ